MEQPKIAPELPTHPQQPQGPPSKPEAPNMPPSPPEIQPGQDPVPTKEPAKMPKG